ncbi:MAG: AI-2E family transporter YdiK [Syntrophaceae bacterium]|nr:AI-2E family transporter YdiK [Syntrophaceae bacterium]
MNMPKPASPDLTLIMFKILGIGILIAASFWIMRPFLPSLLWAAMIVTATWPLMLKAERWLRGKRSLAVAAMTIVMLLVFIIPFSLAIAAIFENAEEISNWVSTLHQKEMPLLPEWVAGIPLVGTKLVAAWDSVISGTGGLSTRLTPYAGKIFNWFLSQAGSVGMIMLQFFLTVIIAAIFYASGEKASDGILRFARRMGGERGEEIAVLAARTVKGVALGVVGTALIQSLLGGIGLAVTGVPAASVLTGVMFIFCVAQLGPSLVLFPAVIWLYYSGQINWGTVLLVWAILVSLLDNFLRPLLIRKGADLPLFMIFAGVIGGLVAFGIVGLFVGPVVLAVAYRLLAVWVDDANTNPQPGA